MRAVFYDFGHPNITLSEWETFRKNLSPFLIDQVIDRHEARLPEWFVPLARGVAIPSNKFLRQVGHRDGMDRPGNWRETSCDFFRWEDRQQKLIVRRSENEDLWTVERWNWIGRGSEVDEVLVFTFGWTPILTRCYQSAMRLAMHCHINGPLPCTRWFKADLDKDKLAIEIARQRQVNETPVATGIQPHGLH